MSNKGIIITGGEFKAGNVVVGEHAKIEVSTPPSSDNPTSNPQIQGLAAQMKGLVAQGHLKEAIQAVLAHFKEAGKKDALNTAVMSSSALTELEMQQSLDLISQEQASIKKAKITQAVLLLIDQEMK